MPPSIFSGFSDELRKVAGKESVLAGLLMSPLRASISGVKHVSEAMADSARTKIFGLGERIRTLPDKFTNDPLMQDLLLRGQLEGKSPGDLQKLYSSVAGLRRQLSRMPSDTSKEFQGLFESFGRGKAGQTFGEAAAARGSLIPTERPAPEGHALKPLLGLTGVALLAAIHALMQKRKRDAEEAKRVTAESFMSAGQGSSLSSPTA